MSSSIHLAPFTPQGQPAAGVRHGRVDTISPPHPDHAQVQASQGSGLRGKQIAVGDGRARNQTLSFGEKAARVFKTGLKGMAFVVLAPVAASVAVSGLAALGASVAVIKSINLAGRLANKHIFEPRAERKYREANRALVTELETPRPGSVLERPGLVSKLREHSVHNADSVTRSEIEQMVAMGENIAAALQHSDGTLPLFFNGYPVTSNTYTARALAWYMMATAASQDLDRTSEGLHAGTSDMVSAGSILLKDPGGKIYGFMNSAPTACSRMSSHFAERTLPGEKHKVLGLIPTGKPRQRGIEDYASKMPGEGGSMLFDRLQDEVLFVKIESGGCPAYFQQEPGQGVLAPMAGICRFFHALDRNVDHSVSFMYTRFAGPSERQVVRQEHLHKGVLKATVDKEFGSLVQDAIASGIIQDDAKAIGKSAHKFGLPYVFQAVRQIRAAALLLDAQGIDGTRCRELIRQCDHVLDLTRREVDRAGPYRGIERKAFETHLAFPDFGPGVEGVRAKSFPPPSGTPQAAAAFESMAAANQAAKVYKNRNSPMLGTLVIKATRDFAAYRKTGQRDPQVEHQSWTFMRQLTLNLKPASSELFLASLPKESLASFSADLLSLNMKQESRRVDQKLG
ncbi:MAG: hypothetical protein V4669_17400 [Pseudomonadota bacterium]